MRRRAGLGSLLALAALLAWGAVASRARADVPAELDGRPIDVIEVEGAPVAPGELGVARGTPLGRREVRALVSRLLASGRWSDVQVDVVEREGGLVLSVRLSPRIVLARIEVDGNTAIDDATIRQIMRVREGAEIEPDALETLADLVRAEYADRGYARARAEVRLRDTDDPARKVLIATIAEEEPIRLRALEWDGDRPPEDDDAPGALGIGLGDVVDRRRLIDGVRAIQARLREHGWLEAQIGEPALQPAEGGVALVLPLRLGRHFAVELRGHAPLERGDVEGVLQLPAEPLNAVVAMAIRDRVLDLYRRHGFAQAEVAVERSRDPARPDDPRAARLLVDITTGPQISVVGVSFPGAAHFSSGFLRDQLTSYLEEDLPDPEVFHPVDSDTVDRFLSGRQISAAREVPADVEVVPERIWYEPTYHEAITHIRELYQAAGFLAVEVGAPERVELDEERSVVAIPIVEGPRTLVYDVRVRGNEVLGTGELLAAADLDRGEAFGYLPLEEARRRILERYAEEGHLFARAEPAVRFSPDGERAEIVFEIVERFPVHIGEIRIEGAEQTSEQLIRDALAIREGDLYRPTLARRSEERLLALGVFASVNVAPADPSLAERTKPVVVTVAERATQAVGLSAGLGTGEGARGTFEYSYRNLFGLALALSLRVQLAYQFFFQDIELERAISPLPVLDRLERRVTVGLSLPWIPGLPGVRASIDLAHVRDNERDFGYDKNGVSLSASFQPERQLAFSLSGELEYNDVSLLGDTRSLRELIEMAIQSGDTRVQRLLRVPEGWSAIGSARFSASWDLRDSAFSPTDGVLISLSAEYAQTIAAEQLDPERAPFRSHFVKLAAAVSGYLEITEGWVLALQGRFGSVVHVEPDSRTYPNRAYYLGGADTLRGFLQDQVIPEDQARLIRERGYSPADIVRTGDIYYLLRAELRFPLVGDLFGGVFADLGNVWAFVDSFDLLVPRVSAGLGLRLGTPIGPIALDYGFNLDRRVDLDEPFGSLHFSIGLF